MERDQNPPFLPDFWQSVRLLLAGLLLFGAPAFLAIHLARRAGLDVPDGWGTPVVYVGTIWLARRWTGRPWSSLLPVQPVRSAWLPGFVVATMGVVVVGHLLDASLEAFLPAPARVEALFESASLLQIVVAAPLLEETLFRGVLLGGYVETYRPVRSVVLCATLFAAWHLLPWQFPIAFVCGVYFSWLAIETGGLVLPVLGHAAVNGAAWLGMRHPSLLAKLAPTSPIPWIFGILLMALGTVLLRRTLRTAPRRSLTMGSP